MKLALRKAVQKIKMAKLNFKRFSGKPLDSRYPLPTLMSRYPLPNSRATLSSFHFQVLHHLKLTIFHDYLVSVGAHLPPKPAAKEARPGGPATIQRKL